MQDVTDLPFMRVIARRGAPDWFVTEYFRVYPGSVPDAYILRSIRENQTGRPIFAQMIGSDVPSLIQTAHRLAEFPIAGIDLNLGCPAPIVCRKNAGGGLLRNLQTVNHLLGEMRDAFPGTLTVKTRIGYHDCTEFSALIDTFLGHAIDGLTIHGRTVSERYQTPVHPDCVRQAVEALPYPVIANGNVVDTTSGLSFLHLTGAAGLMIGRGAIRNPWIFQLLRAVWENTAAAEPTHRDLMEYCFELYEELARETRKFRAGAHVQRMKKTMAYITHGLEGLFEHDMRRAVTEDDFFRICRAHLDHSTLVPALPPSDSKLFCGFNDLLKVTAPHREFTHPTQPGTEQDQIS